jgi:hypothetical protein
MKYQSSITKAIKLTVVVLFLFWLINTLVIINTNGIKDTVVSSVLMFIFAIVFISAFVKGIYVVIENNSLKYVHMFVLRKSIPVEKIKKIQKSLMGGMYTSLSLISDGDNIKEIKIVTITFKKDTLKRFVSDLKRQNPQIEIDQSVNEFIY